MHLWGDFLGRKEKEIDVIQTRTDKREEAIWYELPGWEDYLDRGGICAVEWSENVTEAMEGAIWVRIEKLGEDSRRITIEGGDLVADISL